MASKQWTCWQPPVSQIQKKNHNIQYSWWTKSCTTKDDDYPIIYRVLTIPRWCRICSIKCISPFLQWSQGAPNRPSLSLLEGTIPADARLAVTCHRWDGTMHGIGHRIISMYARAWKNHLRANQLATNDYSDQWHQAAISDYMIEPTMLPQPKTFKQKHFTNCSIFCSQEDWKGCWSGQKMFSPVQAHPILHFSFKVIGFALDSSWDVMLTSNNFRTVSATSISFMGEPSWPKTPMIMFRKQARPMDQVRFQPTSKRFSWLKGAIGNPAAFGFPSERD